MRSAGTSKRRNTFIDGCHNTPAVVACASRFAYVAAGCCATTAEVANAPSVNNAATIFPLCRNMATSPAERAPGECESRELPVQSPPMWKVLVVLLVLAVGAAALWVNAGKAEGPAIDIGGAAVVGQTGEVTVSVTTPGGALTDVTMKLVQGNTTLLERTADSAALGANGKSTTITESVGKRALPELKAGD